MKSRCFFDSEDEFTRLVAIGELASFQQLADDRITYQRGKGKHITYEEIKGVLILVGDAYLSKGEDEINADYIFYDIIQDRIRGESRIDLKETGSSKNRVYITIKPKGDISTQN